MPESTLRLKLDGSQFVSPGRQATRTVAELRAEAARLGQTSQIASRSLLAMRGGIASLLSIAAVTGAIRDFTQAALSVDAIGGRFNAATGSVEAGTRAFAFARAEALRLGLDLETSAGGFAKLSAAARGTALEGRAAAQIFTAVSEASTVLRLSGDQTAGALTAIEQIISKGTVSAEELRGQLGERLPGAFQIAARAMGVTTSELGKMLQQGRVVSDDFLPKFAAELQRTFGSELASAVRSPQAELNRIKTALFELRAVAGKGILEGFVDSLGDLRGELTSDEVRELAREIGQGLGLAARVAAESLAFLVRHASEIRDLLIAILILRAPAYFTSLAASLSVAQAAMASLSGSLAAIRAGYGALVALNIQAAFTQWAASISMTTLALGGAAVALGVVVLAMRNYIDSVNDAYDAELQRLATHAKSREATDLLREATDRLTQSQQLQIASAIETLNAQRDSLQGQIRAKQAEIDRIGTPNPLAFYAKGAKQTYDQELKDLHGQLSEVGRELDGLWAGVDARAKLFGKTTATTTGETSKQVDKLREQLAVIEENIRLQTELQALYREGPGVDAADRLRREQDINQEHERRADAIRQETALGKQLIADVASRYKSEQQIREAIVEQSANYRDQEAITARMKKASEDLAVTIGEQITAGFAANEPILDRLISKLERAAEITAEMATDEERRMRAVAEAAALYGRGLISAETRGRVGRANADPLFTPDQQASRDFVDQTIQSFMTIRQRAQTEMAQVERAFEQYSDDVDMMVVKERALAEIRARLLNEQIARLQDHLSAWGAFFDFLGDRLGGTFQQVANAIRTIQSSIQTGQQVGSSIGSIFGNIAGGAAYGGAAGAIVGIAIAAYDLLEQHQASRRARNYQIGAVVTMGSGGRWNEQGLEGQARQLSNQIMRTAEALAEAIGGVIRDFADLEIHVRRDGKYFQAFVEGELIGKFETVNDAVTAALRAALLNAETSIGGLSDLVRQGLAQVAGTTSPTNLNLDEIQEFLVALRSISELSLSDGALQLRETLRGFDELRASLQRLTTITPAVSQGLSDLRQAEISSWQAWRRSITGQEESPQERLAQQQAEGRMFNAEKQARLAELRLKKADLEAEIVLLRGRGEVARGTNRVRGAELEGGITFVRGIAKLAEAEVNVHQQQIDALTAFIEALGQLIAEIEAIADINIDDIKLPRAGGGGRQDRLDAQAAWRDRYLTVGMQEAERGAYDLARSIEDMRREAREAKIPLDQQIDAQRRLTEEYRRGVQARAETLAGRRGQWDDRLQEVTDFFDGLEAAGRAATGIPDWKRRKLEDEANQRVGQEAVASLGIASAQFLQNLFAINETLEFLTANAERFNLTERDLAGIREQVQAQTFLGLADQMARYITDEGEKRKLAELRYDIEKAQMLVMIEMAHELKAITDAQYAELLRLHGLQPADLPPPEYEGPKFRGYQDAAQTQSDAANRFSQAVEAFNRSTQSLIEAYTGIFTDPTLGGTAEERLGVSKASLDEISRRALSGDIEARTQYGGAARDYLSVLQEINAGGALFAQERERIRAEFHQLMAARQFQVDNVVFGAPFGQTPTITPSPPVAVAGGSAASGDLSQAVRVLQDILIAILKGQTTEAPVLNGILNATSSNATDLRSLISALERIVAKLKVA